MDISSSLYTIFTTLFGILIFAFLSGKGNWKDTLNDCVSKKLFYTSAFTVAICSIITVIAFICGFKDSVISSIAVSLLNFSYGTLITIILANALLKHSTILKALLVIIPSTTLIVFISALPALNDKCSSIIKLCAFKDPSADLVSNLLLISFALGGAGVYKFLVVPRLSDKP